MLHLHVCSGMLGLSDLAKQPSWSTGQFLHKALKEAWVSGFAGQWDLVLGEGGAGVLRPRRCLPPRGWEATGIGHPAAQLAEAPADPRTG
jgi:hypothetical protein